jgi:hypothetical protein
MINRSVTDGTKYTLTPWGGGDAVEYQVVFSGTVGVEGTPLNTDTLLKEATATLYGLDDGNVSDSLKATPNNAFRVIDERFGGLLDFFYPIGTIYQTDAFTSEAAMAAHFGGTWAAWGVGKVPVGYSSGDSDFGTVNGTGGSKTAIQAHTHSNPAHTHTVDNTTATNQSTTATMVGGDGGATSGSTTPGATGTVSTGHTHTYSFSTSSNGSHDHTTLTITSYEGSSVGNWRATGNGAYQDYMSSAGSHTHTGSGTTSDISANHTHTSAAHTHTTPAHTHAQNAHNHTQDAHAHTVTSSGATTSGSTGASGSTNLQPFQVCYFWKRTA